MKYIDRKGNITIEESRQDRFLRHLYTDRGGRLCLKLLVRPFVSKAAGVFLSSGISARLIPGFVKRNKIDLSEYQEERYHSYNQFFTRKIKPEARPIAEGDHILISPCDGKATACRISTDSQFYIKDTLYTVEQLLRNRQLAKRYTDGYALIIRLTVDDYHHFCYTASGKKSRNVVIPGCLHTVNPVANDTVDVYKENAREYTLLKTEKFGTILMMEVGAMLVGKITNCHRMPCEVKKGQEKGYFEFGGSTVVLLFQSDKVRLDFDLMENSENGYETLVRMGERIGEQKLSKRAGRHSRREQEKRESTHVVSS